MPDFRTTVVRAIQAPNHAVWTAWTTPEGMDRWFTTNTVMDFRGGGSYSNGDGDRCEYLSIAPERLIRFSWQSLHHAPGSSVTVDFEDRGAFTEVTLTHENLASQEEADDLNEGWSWALDSLRSYLETGKPIGFDEWKSQRST